MKFNAKRALNLLLILKILLIEILISDGNKKQVLMSISFSYDFFEKIKIQDIIEITMRLHFKLSFEKIIKYKKHFDSN